MKKLLVLLFISSACYSQTPLKVDNSNIPIDTVPQYVLGSDASGFIRKVTLSQFLIQLTNLYYTKIDTVGAVSGSKTLMTTWSATGAVSGIKSQITADSLLLVTANTKITTLIADSAYQASQIAVNTSSISSNASAISSNTSNVASNTSSISGNTTKINELITDSTYQASKINQLITDSVYQAAQIAALIPIYTTYQAFVSQSGTSNPTASRKDSNFGATTFTWARSTAGSYTLTASVATFTSGKTAVLLSPESTALNKYTVTLTSSTVITFSTTVQSVISLILSSVGTDGLLTNVFTEIRVYP